MSTKTPWGVLDTQGKDFYFTPKFSSKALPYAADGLFVQCGLRVMCKYLDQDWEIVRVDDSDTWEPVALDANTLGLLRLQAKVRINAALDYLSGTH